MKAVARQIDLDSQKVLVEQLGACKQIPGVMDKLHGVSLEGDHLFFAVSLLTPRTHEKDQNTNRTIVPADNPNSKNSLMC